MWLKAIATILIFYFLAVLQHSFFAQFNLFGVAPNFVFIFFLLLVFFLPFRKNIVFLSVVAGLLLDIFSYTYLGTSVIFLLAIGFLAKKAQSSLKEKNNEFPVLYFLPIFLFSLAAYNFLLALYFRFLDPSNAVLILDWRIILEIFYNLFFAWIFFIIYKKFFRQNNYV